MNQKFISSAVIVFFLFNVAACSTQKAFVKYEEFKSEMPVKTSDFKGEKLGAVKGEEGGAIWDNCDAKAKGSVREMIANAKKMGANAVGDVIWTASGTSEAACKKGWGYFVLWPFVLTPLFMSTEVTGQAYKVKSARAGLHLIPDTSEARETLVELLVAQAN